jgi:3-isopropylmalate/(R)-2-methylmalate dehydratase large subunit
LLDELGVGLWDPSKIIIVNDHFVPAVDAESAEILRLTRNFAKTNKVQGFFDMLGICHVVLPENGLIRPGAFIAGGDSHTPMAGAFGAYAAGYGATDMAAIVATGETWLSVPATVRVEWSGALPSGVVAKDMMLYLCRMLGLDNAFMAIEFAGATVDTMSMPERMVLCNMAAELGAETGIVAPDSTTLEYLAQTGHPVGDEAAALSFASDLDAGYNQVHRFDATTLQPQIAAPHSPANSADADQFGSVRIDQAYIGACVGAKSDDLRMAAQILAGRKVATGVRLLIAPASVQTTATITSDGTLAKLLAAGAILLPSGCGACAGLGAGVLADEDVCISSSNRNFKGRMGHPGASIYLGSPYSVAAAAVAGRIIDPRELLSDGRGPRP